MELSCSHRVREQHCGLRLPRATTQARMRHTHASGKAMLAEQQQNHNLTAYSKQLSFIQSILSSLFITLSLIMSIELVDKIDQAHKKSNRRYCRRCERFCWVHRVRHWHCACLWVLLHNKEIQTTRSSLTGTSSELPFLP